MTQASRGHLSMLVFSALVAGSFSLGSMTANEISPAALNAVRFCIAGLVVGLVAALTGRMRAAHFRAPWRFLVLGGLFGAYFVMMFEGLKTAPPVSAAAVFTLTPVITGGIGYLILRQIVTPRMAKALVIGAIGALWVIFRADLAALVAFDIGRGEAIYFVGCVSHAVYTVLVRYLNRGEPAMVFTFGTLLGGALTVTLWGWRDLWATEWLALPGIVWVTLLYLSIFTSAITVVLLQFASMRLPAAKVMAYTYLTPSWVILWEIALGHGAPTPWVIAGVLMTILALWLLLKEEAKPAPQGTDGERGALDIKSS